MPVVIEQIFPLGRFQARRWNQPPFDPGSVEWPPSPWRLLRAIAARWFQYCLETGDDDTVCRDAILAKLAKSPPSFRLPREVISGPELRQYQPTEVKFTKKKTESEMKRPLTTLVPDRSQSMPTNESLLWIWKEAVLFPEERDLLVRLLRRIHYFGRAESWTRLRLHDETEALPKVNCTVSAAPSSDSSPILVNTSPDELIERLLTATGDKRLANRPIPLGTAWHYAKTPSRIFGATAQTTINRPSVDPSIRIARFALDGPVLPLAKNTVQVAESFRRAVMSMFGRCCAGRDEAARFLRSDATKYASPTFSGKNREGMILETQQHAYFLPMPDRIDPRRIREVVVYAPSGLEPLEITALKRLRDVKFEGFSCRAQLIGLGDISSVKPRLGSPSTAWVSLTPFIAHRHAKSRGRNRDIPQDPNDPKGSFLAVVAREICQQRGLPLVEASPLSAARNQLQFYEFRRARRKAGNDAYTRMAGYLRLTFAEPISGPLCLGYNSHFGMGLFLAEEIS